MGRGAAGLPTGQSGHLKEVVEAEENKLVAKVIVLEERRKEIS